MIIKDAVFWRFSQSYGVFACERRPYFMKLYKYRSLGSFDRFADILLNKRFYAAKYAQLNDPMEGLVFSEGTAGGKSTHQFCNEREKYRVVSFSADRENVLLWAHYADSFRGVCIGVDIEDSLVNRVRYDEASEEAVGAQLQTDENASNVFGRKLSAWSYEKEYRVVTAAEYFENGFSISEIRLGQRIDQSLEKLIFQHFSGEYRIVKTKVIQNGNAGVVIADECSEPATLHGMWPARVDRAQT